MTDEQGPPQARDGQRHTARGSATRRGFFALAGATALAGCTGLGDVLGDNPPKLDGGELKGVLSTPFPSVTERFPIPIEESYLNETAASVEQRLTTVPAPFDAQEIPNGAIREELSEMYDDATGELEDAADEPSPLETMRTLRDAREQTRAVTASWAAIDDGLAFADVRKSVPQIRSDIDAFRGQWSYVGDDPIRAILAHRELEVLVASAGRRSRDAPERYSREQETPILVGKFAGDLEEARAALDDAEYLYDRYESSMDDPRQVRSEIVSLADSLARTFRDRLKDLPNGDGQKPSSFVEPDIEDTPVAAAMTKLFRDLDYADGLADELKTGQRTRAILSAHESLVRVRAFESLRERVNDGEYVTVESTEDVRKIRNSAIAAFEDALASREKSRLNRYVLSQIDGAIRYADRELDDYDEDDDVSVGWINRELGQYVLVGAMARATPPTSATVADEIQQAF
ncbi:hypothetical protein E6P09_17750 (plasmid) [Haloferax mediterranei ATCC 33500]|uniref:Uncharacterized protein n=1 Tax=Haloferax mediterranei (strain ATCC 33500 / DSM 1411 / JCM 8866 / NBRC 14739 / NCIMB 2177 / R-4) TaxID=523841 RepID=I3R9U7_HALMT|nr:hypothetical protein [Haloferax mediterranei]AFK21007.1 hypothetical protein HFX_5173 [Haloferax mediterranei ATCC 33500]AHZ24131.1 hypothetical protein BM92_18170 [Haloferax mediterranei ATCC 33500]EMA05207.1 hypothetical protein C439_00370 [Haloferax mediterranei ATCC 33500]MDX5989988.1 hypothetical protein [Haloferax mediterranei ATCC 33500]QCQ77171.1 hypothetical protein E6P09_17750 [Haloferax mediterranei ATCC 33500]